MGKIFQITEDYEERGGYRKNYREGFEEKIEKLKEKYR